jgi:hypothetical protein
VVAASGFAKLRSCRSADVPLDHSSPQASDVQAAPNCQALGLVLDHIDQQLIFYLMADDQR